MSPANKDDSDLPQVEQSWVDVDETFGIAAPLSGRESESSTTSSAFLNADIFNTSNPRGADILATARDRVDETRALGPPPQTPPIPEINHPNLPTSHVPRCLWNPQLAYDYHVLNAAKTLFYRATSLQAWDMFTAPDPPNPTSMGLTFFHPVGTESFILISITRHHSQINTRTTAHVAIPDLHTPILPSDRDALSMFVSPYLYPPGAPITIPPAGTIHHSVALKSVLNGDRSWSIQQWSSETQHPAADTVRFVRTTQEDKVFRRRMEDAAKVLVYVAVKLDELVAENASKGGKGFVKVVLE